MGSILLLLLPLLLVLAGTATLAAVDVGTTFYYHGSIQNVIAGRVQPNAAKERVDPADVFYGFSVGSRESLSSMGNLVALNGYVHNRNTNASSPGYYAVEAGPEPFVSTSSVYLLPGEAGAASPHARYSFSGRSVEGTEVTRAIYQLAGGRPHCYAGLASFEALQGVALTKSPVFGQNIFKNKSAYFAEPPCCLNATAPAEGPAVPATLMGCAADLAGEKNATLKALLERVLYVNPFGVPENLTVHVEVMQLRRPVVSIDEILPGDGVAIDHMLEQSVFSSIDVDVYLVGDLQPLPPAAAAARR